jgi:nitrile hydratase beta subunit
MNGVHDIGGMHGFGPVDPEPEAEEPVFHSDWEARVFALWQALGAVGAWNIDMGRHARERLTPVEHMAASYYELSLNRIELLLVENGVLTAEELRSGRAEGPAADTLRERRLGAEDVVVNLGRSRSFEVPAEEAPSFQVGDRIRVRPMAPLGHTRAARYVRGHYGTVRAHYGAHVFPDRNAHGERVGKHLYSVEFSSRELFGDEAGPRDTVRLDLWEPYLLAADAPGARATASAA